MVYGVFFITNGNLTAFKIMKLNNSVYAVLSGLCAASASVFGKLCGLPVFEVRVNLC